MRQWTGSALVQIMACRLFGANPSQMQINCSLDPWGQISVKFKSKFNDFHLKKLIHKMSSLCLIWSFCRYQSVGSHHCLSELAFPLSAGSCLNIKTVFPGTGIPVFKIRQSCHQKSHLLGPGKSTTLSYGRIKPGVIAISKSFHKISCSLKALRLVI